MKFSFKKIDNGLYQVDKHYSPSKSGSGNDISGPYWMLMQIELLQGSLSWLVDNKLIPSPGAKVYLFVPPFSWTSEHYSKGSELKVMGLISKLPLKNTPPGACLLWTDKKFPKSISEAEYFLKSSSQHQAVSVCTKASALSMRTKELLDSGYQEGLEIQDIAKKLKTSSAVVTRSFKKDFGRPPAFYRKGIRVTVGMFELMMGSSPIQAAELAGYGDLSRFYKQFKSYMQQTPGDYTNKSKNAKKKS